MNTINVSPLSSNNPCTPSISFSFLNYYLNIKSQILEMFDKDSDLSGNKIEDAIRIINPYEFIFSKVPGSKYSVSKLKPSSNLFYDLFEIYSNLNCFDNFHSSSSLKSLHISPNHVDSIECFEMFREGFDDEIVWWNTLNIDHFTDIDKKFDFMFLEYNFSNNKEYFNFLTNSISCVLKNQNYNGNLVLKIGDIFHKPTTDCLYFLTSLYEKVYIAKPYTNNISSNEKYVVCKQFKHNSTSNLYLRLNYLKLIIFSKKLEDNHITDILDANVPYYFKNKIDDLNIIIGQQQLEAMDLLISIFKNKNKNEKIENIKKSNIQKSVAWCEKYKIPYNKFTEKINIFLPIINNPTHNPNENRNDNYDNSNNNNHNHNHNNGLSCNS
jgi:hypothetical protein